MNKNSNALARDFDNVVTDAQELLKTIGNQGDARVTDAKKRMQASLTAAKNRLLEFQTTVTDGAREAANTADDYAHDNPWALIGASAAVGMLVGYLLGRR